MNLSLSRRTFLAATGALAAVSHRGVVAQAAGPAFNLPMGLPGRTPGEGCYIKRGYACEGPIYLPGWWHTGENWFLTEGDSAGAEIYAVADGTVVFVGSNYPGRVVIVQHGDELYSMYGHLDFEPPVVEGEAVGRGQIIGTVLYRTDGRSPSHLHFEIRNFLTTPEVNGDAPRYGFACGYQCPPGPGYWPIDAPEHPTVMGWRNPLHAIANLIYADGDVPAGAEIAVIDASPGSVEIWSGPPDRSTARNLGSLPLTVGDRLPLLEILAAPADSIGTSAEAYQLWYRIRTPDGEPGWVPGVIPSFIESGNDGRPSAVLVPFTPAP